MRIVTDFSVTSAPLRGRHGWHPGWLFRGGALGGWYDPSDPATPFSDLIGVDPAGLGYPVGLALDKSGNANHATQAAVAARPIYGIVPATGRRNRLPQTETLASPWNAYNVHRMALAGGVTSLAPNAIEIQHYAYLNNFAVWDAAEAFTFSMEVKVTDPEVFRHMWLETRTKDNQRPRIVVDLTTGEKEGGGGAVFTTATALEDGWWRVSLTANAGTGSTGAQCVITPCTGFASADRTFVGDNAASLLVRKPQAEQGPTATAYQSAGTQYDVTEVGVRSLPYLHRDGVDDALEATLPDLGTYATVAWASDQGVTILTGQTIGAGAFDLLRDEMLFGFVVIDRALSAVETARLTEWLEQNAGAFA